MVVLDTNIIIDHLRQENWGQPTRLMQIAEKWSQSQLAVSVISIQELYEEKSMNQFRNEQQVLAILSSLKILPYTMEVAQRAGQIARDLPDVIGFADVAIAATCLVNRAQLATLNQKHFQLISGLDIV